jgi:enediyne biosynthesis protein E4
LQVRFLISFVDESLRLMLHLVQTSMLMFKAAGPQVGGLLLLLLCLTSAVIAQENIRFVDATATSGIDFVHEDGADDEGYLPSLMSGGLASADFDNDGRIDVYLLSGCRLPGSSGGPLPAPAAATERPNGTNQQFRNLGDNRFSNVTVASGGGLNAFGLGTAVGDFDNDGFKDIAISNYGSISLLRNNGDGTWIDCTAAAGLENSGIAFGAGVAFLDIENDGDLDLYVADYVKFDFDQFKKLAPVSYPYPPGPEQFEHRSDHLYRNNGDGTFTDISVLAGIAQIKSPSMGVVCGDFDHDHDTDIFVCCDARPNLLFINDGHGRFTQDAELFAVAYNATGIPVGSMGAEAGDVDNDGAEDIFITDYSAQMPILFKNLGELGFEDISRISKSGRDVVPHANWGAGLVDLDNDGDRDLMIANGHLIKWASRIEQLTSFKVRNTLLSNNGRGVFTNVTDSAGDGLSRAESSRGMAFDDFDNDGDLDCVVLNSDSPANYLINQTATNNHWVAIQLVGREFNRDGVGARVTIYSGDLVQVAEMRSGRGYQSSYGSRLHFGLGARSKIDRIQVEWLGHTREYTTEITASGKRPLAVNRLHILSE